MTRHISVLVAIAALCSALLYAGCSSATEAPTAEPSQAEQADRSSGFGEYGVKYWGLVTMEELVVNSTAVARVEFVSAVQTIETLRYVFTSGNQLEEYAGAVVVTFDVLEYLKGSGGNQIEAVLYDGDWRSFDKADITAANEDFLAFRDKQWDDREAIVFLRSGQFIPSTLSDSDRYFMTYLRANGEHGYTVDSRWAKAWLPAAAPSSNGQASGASGDSQLFITNIENGPSGGGASGQSGSQRETMTLAEIKAVIEKIDDELAAGEGITDYAACVRKKYQWARLEALTKGGRGDSYYRQFEADIASGAAAGVKVYTGGDYVKISEASRAAEPPWADDLVVKSGQDAELFAHTWPLIATNARPLPAGAYRFYWAEQGRLNALCDAMPEDHRTRNEVVVTVTAPEGTLHETMFDPVTFTGGVGATTNQGAISHRDFSVGGSRGSVSVLRWRNGKVVLKLDPFVSLVGYRLDFIETDGTVGLSLDASSATVDTTAKTLRWDVAEQPWEAGDLLMVRIGPSLKVTISADNPSPTAGQAVTFTPAITNAPQNATPTYDWQFKFGDGDWLSGASGRTLKTQGNTGETVGYRVVVKYGSGGGGNVGDCEGVVALMG